MSYSLTVSNTITTTDARYIAGKVASDLKQLQLFYGKPSDSDIQDYVEELVAMLPGNYVQEVKYGFEKNGEWIVALQYRATYGGGLTDTGSGKVPVVEIGDASFHSYLIHTNSWAALPPSRKESLLVNVGFRRTSGSDPRSNAAGWSYNKAYSVNGNGLQRGSYANA